MSYSTPKITTLPPTVLNMQESRCQHYKQLPPSQAPRSFELDVLTLHPNPYTGGRKISTKRLL
jgi:hypothetical protein